MSRRYIWIGIVVLVGLCLLVNIGAATQTTLKEGNVELAVSAVEEVPINYTAIIHNSANFDCRLEYDHRFREYEKYYVYKGILDNRSDKTYDDIPEVVIQPIDFRANLIGGPIVGSGVLKVWKRGIANAALRYVYVDYEFVIDMNQTWQNSISSDATLYIFNPSQPLTTSIPNLVQLGEFYGDTGPIFKMGVSQGMITFTEFHTNYGLVVAPSNGAYPLGSNIPYEQTDIIYQTEFYNEYKIYADDIGYRGINITRVGSSEFAGKLTKSKVWVLDKNGALLYWSPFYQDVNTTHTFPAQPIAVWLIAANMESDGTDKPMQIYDDTGNPSYCTVKGYTYDAELGTILTNVSVSLDGFSDTSDEDGYYFIGPVVAGRNYTLIASKSGYYDVIYDDLYLPYAQDYLIDIPLIPTPPSHTGHGILGIVRTLPYYLPAENQLVRIRNATWLNTTYTNNVGDYLFDNLEVGDYWINVSKNGYVDNNQLVTVSATGDVIVTIDACDATTDWQSDNSLTLNTTDKQEGTGSLQSSGSATLDFNKSASTAVDASNVTKSNGYLTFWYKVNDTSRLDDYITFTIGSNGNNDTNKISWSVYKANFVNDTWKEIWLKFSDGTETGTLNMSNINWTEVIAPKSDTVLSKIDNIRFYDFSYEIHNVDLALISTEEEEAEGGVGVYYPPPHLVEFAVVDIWGRPLTGVNVIATGYETTVANLSWWQKLFGFSSEIEVYNCSMNGTTDDAGHISFFMVETIKYKMQFSGGTQNVSATYYIYPKDDRYTITIGTIPEQKIAYWVATQQNDTANTGNITFHYCDYNIPVKTSWVNFSVYYMDNNTLAYTYNFTSINQTNENTSINLNASYAYRVKYVTNHADFGTITGYVTVVFLMPERPKMPVIRELLDNLEDWQVTMFSMFIIIFAAFIFGAVTSGIGGLVVAFMSYGFYYFGMLPLIPKAAAYVIFPLIIIVAVLNLLSEQKGVPEE